MLYLCIIIIYLYIWICIMTKQKEEVLVYASLALGLHEASQILDKCSDHLHLYTLEEKR